MGPYNQGKAAAVAAAAAATSADLAIQEALVVSLLSLCMSSLRRGHANLLCIVPILSDDLRDQGLLLAPHRHESTYHNSKHNNSKHNNSNHNMSAKQCPQQEQCCCGRCCHVVFLQPHQDAQIALRKAIDLRNARRICHANCDSQAITDQGMLWPRRVQC